MTVKCRYFLAKPKGADDSWGIVLPDFGPSEAVLRRAAELLSHVNAAPLARKTWNCGRTLRRELFLRNTCFIDPLRP